MLISLKCFSYILCEYLFTEGTVCVTPRQEDGICIPIKSCNSIITLLKTQGATPEISALLRQSQCGWKGPDPMICCPQQQTRITSTERVVESTPEVREITSPDPGVILPRPPLCGRNNITKTRIVNGVPALLGM